MLHLLCIIMVTMSLMIMPSFGTNFRLTPLEGSVKKTKGRNIKSFEDVQKLFNKQTKTPVYPIFHDKKMLYQSQNVMSSAMYYAGEKEGRPFGMYLDPSKTEELEAFRKKISEPFTKKNSKKNPGRVAKGYEYKKGTHQVALYINIPQAIASKTKFGKIEPGWIWMWVSPRDKINHILGTKAFWKKGPWIFALRCTEFKAPKSAAAPAAPAAPVTPAHAAHARIDFADNMDYYDDVYDDLYDDDEYDAYDYAAEYDIYNQRQLALNRLLTAYGLYYEDLIEN